jgi:hypothetical protein
MNDLNVLVLEDEPFQRLVAVTALKKVVPGSILEAADGIRHPVRRQRERAFRHWQLFCENGTNLKFFFIPLCFKCGIIN